MFKISRLFTLAAAAAVVGSLASCSNDNEPNIPQNTPSTSVLVSAPTIKAWSGDEDFGKRNARRIVAEGEAPAEVTASEVAAAKAYFDNLDNTYRHGDFTIDAFAGWTNYYVQEVASGNRLPSSMAIYIGTNSETIDNIAVWDLDAEEVLKLLKTDAYLTHEARLDVDPSAAQLVTGHAIKDFTFETFGESFGGYNIDGSRNSGHNGSYDFSPNYKIGALDGQEDALYVALYGYNDYDQNNGFWNRIIKITKAKVEDAEEEEVPGADDDDAIVTDKILHNHEVEVNLSLNDTHRYYNREDLTSKLSIHVRAPKDVKVRIPVPVETLVLADDLDLVKANPDLMNVVKSEGGNKLTFEINGHKVELTVDFTVAKDCAGNGFGCYIEVTTNGINKDVIDYCMEQNEDGLNFEIFNYYQWVITNAEGENINRKPTQAEIDKLRTEWLDKSTVEFGYYSNGDWVAYINQSDYPWYYINALDSDNDCVVKVISNQSYAYENYFVGPHLNGSDNNVVYVRNDIYGTEKQDLAHFGQSEE